jgi:hypothetical protein
MLKNVRQDIVPRSLAAIRVSNSPELLTTTFAGCCSI